MKLELSPLHDLVNTVHYVLVIRYGLHKHCIIGVDWEDNSNVIVEFAIFESEGSLVRLTRYSIY